MRVCIKTARIKGKAFTLVEVLMAFTLMVVVLTGVFYAYAQANRLAQFSAMSLAAQSAASQGLEYARSAQWDMEAPTNGDQLPATNRTTPVLTDTNTLDVPQTGNFITITNYVYETTNEDNPPLRELRSVVVWTFPVTRKVFTNVAVTLRAPDE